MTAETYERVMSDPDPSNRIALGCNDCDEYLTQRQLNEDPGADYQWMDLGDDGVVCPKCAAEYDRIDGVEDEDK